MVIFFNMGFTKDIIALLCKVEKLRQPHLHTIASSTMFGLVLFNFFSKPTLIR